MQYSISIKKYLKFSIPIFNIIIIVGRIYREYFDNIIKKKLNIMIITFKKLNVESILC